jgi:hypothetical protein
MLKAREPPGQSGNRFVHMDRKALGEIGEATSKPGCRVRGYRKEGIDHRSYQGITITIRRKLSATRTRPLTLLKQQSRFAAALSFLLIWSSLS